MTSTQTTKRAKVKAGRKSALVEGKARRQAKRVSKAAKRMPKKIIVLPLAVGGSDLLTYRDNLVMALISVAAGREIAAAE